MGWDVGALCGNIVPAGQKDNQKKYLDPKDMLNMSFKSLIW